MARMLFRSHPVSQLSPRELAHRLTHLTLNRAGEPGRMLWAFVGWIPAMLMGSLMSLMAVGASVFVPYLIAAIMTQSEGLGMVLGGICGLAVLLYTVRWGIRQEKARACEERASLLETELLFQLLTRVSDVEDARVELFMDGVKRHSKFARDGTNYNMLDTRWTGDGVRQNKRPQYTRSVEMPFDFTRYRDEGWALGWLLNVPPRSASSDNHRVTFHPVGGVWCVRVEVEAGGIHPSVWGGLPEGVESSWEGEEGESKFTVLLRDHKGVFRAAIESGDGCAMERAKELAASWSDVVYRVLRPVVVGDPGALQGENVSSFCGVYPSLDEPVEGASASYARSLRVLDEDETMRWGRRAMWGSLAGNVGVSMAAPLAGLAVVLNHIVGNPLGWGSLALLGVWALANMYAVRGLQRLWGHDVVKAGEERQFRKGGGVLALDRGVLQMGEVRVDLSTPFSVTYTRGEDAGEGGDGELGVSLVQTKGGGDVVRCAFRVRVARSSWWESLPELRSDAVEVDAEDFDGWIAPTLGWYANMHGEESAVESVMRGVGVGVST